MEQGKYVNIIFSCKELWFNCTLCLFSLWTQSTFVAICVVANKISGFNRSDHQTLISQSVGQLMLICPITKPIIPMRYTQMILTWYNASHMKWRGQSIKQHLYGKWVFKQSPGPKCFRSWWEEMMSNIYACPARQTYFLLCLSCVLTECYGQECQHTPTQHVSSCGNTQTIELLFIVIHFKVLSSMCMIKNSWSCTYLCQDTV